MEEKQKTLNTAEYMSALRELTEQGHEVSITISGNSMAPFLVHLRDSVTFGLPKRSLKRGDLVFYQRDSGQFVCHRIFKVRQDDYYLIGDAQTMPEGPIRREQIFALVTAVRRKGKVLTPGDFCWAFFEKIWIRILPLRLPLLRVYRLWRRFRSICNMLLAMK